MQAGMGSRPACSRPRPRPRVFEAKAKPMVFEANEKRYVQSTSILLPLDVNIFS